jgi:protease-4
MKSFFASLLGSLVGLFLFGFLVLLIFVGVIGAVAALGDKPVVVPKGSYLVFDLTANIHDGVRTPSPFDVLEAIENPEHPKNLQLRAVTRALGAAAKDDRIKGMLLTGNISASGYASSFAALAEVRRALVEFKKSGKPVMAHLFRADANDLYLASTADEILLDPYGQVDMAGLASEGVFFAGAMEKVGLEAQVVRVGKYKSAIEPFTSREMSPASREQLQVLLDSAWTTLRDEIASARGLAPDALQALVDSERFFSGEAAVKAGLVTRVAYQDEVIDELKRRTESKPDAENFARVAMASYAKRAHPAAPKSASGKAAGVVAVVYAEGVIVDGEGGEGEIGGKRFARELRRLRQDPKVSAIVLRVNSPGGSASASEHILREVRLARETKPVVVSMGGYAASGGYWISSFGDHVFAEPTTITGSIGVFGLIFNAAELTQKLGVSFDVVKTGRYADMLSISRAKTEDELALIQRDVDHIYRDFLSRVAEGRKLDPALVAELAQGRVWIGSDALTRGLVDEMGGLEDAIRYAAKKAGVDENYTVRERPAHKPFAESFAEALQGLEVRIFGHGPLGRVLARMELELEQLNTFNDPRGIYARLPFEFVLR